MQEVNKFASWLSDEVESLNLETIWLLRTGFAVRKTARSALCTFSLSHLLSSKTRVFDSKANQFAMIPWMRFGMHQHPDAYINSSFYVRNFAGVMFSFFCLCIFGSWCTMYGFLQKVWSLRFFSHVLFIHGPFLTLGTDQAGQHTSRCKGTSQSDQSRAWCVCSMLHVELTQVAQEKARKMHWMTSSSTTPTSFLSSSSLLLPRFKLQPGPSQSLSYLQPARCFNNL